MKDLALELENLPGALAEMGETLGRAGVSVEGGGVWVVNGVGICHFLFEDGAAARRALEAAGIRARRGCRATQAGSAGAARHARASDGRCRREYRGAV